MPKGQKTIVEEARLLPAARRRRMLTRVSVEAARLIGLSWEEIARPSQLPPLGQWIVWLLLAGRGSGKTRAGAEWVRAQAAAFPGCRIALVGATAADTRDTMVEGQSGLLAISPDDFRPAYEPSKRRLRWPNGSQATCFSADEPDRLRGPQHHFAWADELAAWRHAEAWDMLLLGLRLGVRPRVVVSTTPRPTALIRKLASEPTTHVTRGTTYENRANLAPAFFAQILAQYEGTRLGRQELEAEILDDTPGALWTIESIERGRVRAAPALRRVVVAIDPSVSGTGGGDECGIVVAGLGVCRCGPDSSARALVEPAGRVERAEELHAFVLEDLSGHLAPDAWARRAAGAYRKWKADRIIAEANNGGALVEANVRTVDRSVAYRAVHASQGKRARAEPISSLYEQRKVHHAGAFPALEDELRTWEPLGGRPSPNRLDALVWALTDLVIDAPRPGTLNVNGPPPRALRLGRSAAEGSRVLGVLSDIAPRSSSPP